MDLSVFPFVALSKVNLYHEECEKYADEFAKVQSQKESKASFQEIKDRTLKGMKSKVAAILVKGKDPKQLINFNFKPGVFDTFIESSDIMTAGIDNVENNKVSVSIHPSKYDKILKRIKMNSYAEFVEFIYFDSKNELYYHIGKAPSEKLLDASKDVKGRKIFEFNIPDCRIDNIFNY